MIVNIVEQHRGSSDRIRALSITTQAQADGYRRALELWDKHPCLTPEQINVLMDAALHTHDKARYEAVCALRKAIGFNPAPVKCSCQTTSDKHDLTCKVRH